jgi:hypothetical protein
MVVEAKKKVTLGNTCLRKVVYAGIFFIHLGAENRSVLGCANAPLIILEQNDILRHYPMLFV